jgi:plastocyanin
MQPESGSANMTLTRRGFFKGVGFLGVTALAGSLVGCRHEEVRKSLVGGQKSPVIAVGGEKNELIFVPDRLRIEPGEKVTWVLESGGHTATAYHPQNHSEYRTRIPEGAEPWDSDLLVQKGATFSWTPTVEGVYNYFCRPHDCMRTSSLL